MHTANSSDAFSSNPNAIVHKTDRVSLSFLFTNKSLQHFVLRICDSRDVANSFYLALFHVVTNGKKPALSEHSALLE
jgi:hypothetical protein